MDRLLASLYRSLSSSSSSFSFRRRRRQPPDCQKKKKKKEEEEAQQQLDAMAASISSSSSSSSLLLLHLPPPPPPPPGDSMAEFEARLSGRLRHLSLAGGGAPQQQLNLAWLSDALAIAVSTQSSLLHALQNPALAASSPSPPFQLAHHALPCRRRRRRHVVERSQLELHIDGLVCLIDHANALRRATQHMAEQLSSLDRSLAAFAHMATLALNAASAPNTIAFPLAAASLRLLSSVASASPPAASVADRARYAQACRHMKKRLKKLLSHACPSSSFSAARCSVQQPDPAIASRALLGLSLTTNLILCTLLSTFISPPGGARTTLLLLMMMITVPGGEKKRKTKKQEKEKRMTSAPSPRAAAAGAAAAAAAQRLCRSASDSMLAPAQIREHAIADSAAVYNQCGPGSSGDEDAAEAVAVASWAAPFRKLQGQLLLSWRSREEKLGLAGEGLLAKEVMMIQAAAGALALRLAAAATISSGSSNSRSSRRRSSSSGGSDGGGGGEKAAGGWENALQERQRAGVGAAAAAAAALGKAARELRGGVMALHQQACSLAMAMAELRVALLDAFCTTKQPFTCYATGTTKTTKTTTKTATTKTTTKTATTTTTTT